MNLPLKKNEPKLFYPLPLLTGVQCHDLLCHLEVVDPDDGHVSDVAAPDLAVLLAHPRHEPQRGVAGPGVQQVGDGAHQGELGGPRWKAGGFSGASREKGLRSLHCIGYRHILFCVGLPLDLLVK